MCVCVWQPVPLTLCPEKLQILSLAAMSQMETVRSSEKLASLRRSEVKSVLLVARECPWKILSCVLVARLNSLTAPSSPPAARRRPSLRSLPPCERSRNLEKVLTGSCDDDEEEEKAGEYT